MQAGTIAAIALFYPQRARRSIPLSAWLVRLCRMPGPDYSSYGREVRRGGVIPGFSAASSSLLDLRTPPERSATILNNQTTAGT
jgi:hypothetical protein